MQTVQVTNVTVDELVSRLKEASGTPTISPQLQPATITVLNKKEAAKVLCISETYFDKLLTIGIIPPTVHAGYNKRHEEIKRWAQHHLIAIKPIIQNLKHQRDDDYLIQAKYQVKQTLGL